MVSKVVAILSVVTALVLCQLGNYWYTFGLWPRSWASFIAFWGLSFILTALMQALLKEK